MPAKSKRASKVRQSTEFSLSRMTARLQPPKTANGGYDWTLQRIREARAAQLRGDFRLAVELATAMRTDAALFTAQLNRLAPSRGLPVQLRAASDSARAERVRDEAEGLFGPRGIGITPDTVTSIHSALADHGLAVGRNTATPREDGTRVDLMHAFWPTEHVRWDAHKRTLVTRVERGDEVPITHGDGEWVVYRNHEHEPWKHGAVVPGALTWGARAFGVHDLAKGSRSHAGAKTIGTLPQGLALQNADGTLTQEATEFLDLMQAIANEETPFGIAPFGSAIQYLVNTSQAWQVYSEVIKLGDRDAAKIYLGQDGTTSDTGGNYVKSRFLFGVRNDIVEADLKGAIERAILTGIIEPWCALNFGDSTLAPVREYLMPDSDEDARRESENTRRESGGKRLDSFFSTLERAKALGVLTQEYADQAANELGVPSVVLPPPAATPSIPIAPAGAAPQGPRPVPAASAA